MLDRAMTALLLVVLTSLALACSDVRCVKFDS